MTHEDDPNDRELAELADLARAERGFAPPPPAGVEARVLANVEARVAAGGDHGRGPDDPGGTPPPGGAAPGGVALGKRVYSANAVLAALATGVVIGAAGMYAMATRDGAGERALRAPSASITVIPPVPSALDAGPTPMPATSGEPADAGTPDASARVAPGSASLHDVDVDGRGVRAERNLLDGARASLAKGEATEALAACDRHARTYPAGALVEEREAVAIKALVALGRLDDAKARAARFRERFPRSVSLPSIESALSGPR